MARATKKANGSTRAAPKARGAGAAKPPARKAPPRPTAADLREHAAAIERHALALQDLCDGFGREALEARGELVATRDEARQARGEVEALRRQAREAADLVAGMLQEVRQALLARPAVAAGEPESGAEIAAPANGRNHLGVTVAPGVVVARVVPDSAAAAAGLAAGDVIEAVNGRPVASGVELRDAVLAVTGDELTLRFSRGGTSDEVRVALGAGEADEAEHGEGRNRLGVNVAPGVVVTEVLLGSPAAVAGLLPGDVIVGVNDALVHNGEELRAAIVPLLPGSEVAVEFARRGERQTATVRLES
jgi:S1-C subfamily serine protease